MLVTENKSCDRAGGGGGALVGDPRGNRSDRKWKFLDTVPLFAKQINAYGISFVTALKFPPFDTNLHF